MQEGVISATSAVNTGALSRFFLGADEHDHLLALKHGQLLGLAVFLKLVGEFEEENLSLHFKDDLASLEEYIGFHLATFLQEFNGVVLFEIEIVLVGMGPETDVLNNNFRGLGFDLLGLFLLLVQEFAVVNDLANWRIDIGRYLNKIKTFFTGHFKGALQWINASLDVLADDTHFCR